MPDSAIIRLAVAGMILLPTLPTFLATGRELYEHLAGGGSPTAVPAKIAGTIVCGALVLVGAIVIARALRAINIFRRGEETPAAVTRVEPQRDGAWKVSYEYRDRGGESHRGVFYADTNIWREGDRGPVRFDLGAPAHSTWIGPDPAGRAPGPPLEAPDMRKTLSRFRGVVMALASIIAACAVLGFWTAIWRDGGARTYEAWQTAVVLAGIFVVVLPFAAAGGLAVVAAGLLGWMCFVVVRRVLRD